LNAVCRGAAAGATVPGSKPKPAEPATREDDSNGDATGLIRESIASDPAFKLGVCDAAPKEKAPDDAAVLTDAPNPGKEGAAAVWKLNVAAEEDGIELAGAFEKLKPVLEGADEAAFEKKLGPDAAADDDGSMPNDAIGAGPLPAENAFPDVPAPPKVVVDGPD
jgi:hypothetical protein